MKRLFIYFQEDKHYSILFISTLLVSILGYIFVQKIPKPETFIELGKYLFNDTGSYLFSIVLFLIISCAYAFCGAFGTYNTYQNWQDISNLSRAFSIIFVVILIILSLYFASYFLLTFLVLVAFLFGVFIIFKALADR